MKTGKTKSKHFLTQKIINLFFFFTQSEGRLEIGKTANNE